MPQIVGLHTVEQRMHMRSGGAGFAQQAEQSAVLAMVDDAGVVGAAQAFGVEFLRLGAASGDESGLLRPRQQHVVRGDASLPGVDQFAEQNALGGVRQVVVRGDDCGRLAAEFQRHGREMRGGRGHHALAHTGGAGEQQMVEGQRAEGRADFGIALHHRHFVGREGLRGALREHRAERGRVFGELDHRAVARHQRGRERRHGQHQRVVPRRDDAHHAQRLGNQLRASGQEPARHGGPARTHPARAVA